MPFSGNCYKVRLIVSLLGLECQRIDLDLKNGEHKGDKFTSLNPDQKIPALVLDDGRVLTESNAILCYLAEGTGLMPSDPYDRAQVLKWLFFEQANILPNIAIVRAWHSGLKGGLNDLNKTLLPGKMDEGNRTLAIINSQLGKTDYLVGHELTVADISLYAYVHVAEVGKYDLSLYPNIQQWLARIAGTNGYITMAE